MSPIEETDRFTLVIPRHANSEVLLELRGDNYLLPRIDIPQHRRVAEFLTKRVKEEWGLEAVCLFDPTEENGIHPTGTSLCQVLEVRDARWLPPGGLRWVNRSSLRNGPISPGNESVFLENALQLADAFDSGKRQGPFAKTGWIDDLITWAEPTLRRRGLSLTGTIRQVNAGPFFSLLQLETDQSSVWFKAIGEPLLHEYEITKGLADRYSRYLPEVLTFRPDLHGWLMIEHEGTGLRETTNFDDWRSVAATLSAFQIDLVEETDWLLRIGCKDRRLSTIQNEIDPFFEIMAEVMRRQPQTPPRILTQRELRQLGSDLKQACQRLDLLGISDSLIHGDFSPGNISVSPGGCVFMDWAEAYVGPPFITFEYLLAHLRRVHPTLGMWQKPLREAYLERWHIAASSEQIDSALDITPAIAVLCHALSTSAWHDPNRLRDPNCAKYMRSLVRRMHQEIADSSARELHKFTGIVH